jgi:hypothetical protein
MFGCPLERTSCLMRARLLKGKKDNYTREISNFYVKIKIALGILTALYHTKSALNIIFRRNIIYLLIFFYRY